MTSRERPSCAYRQRSLVESTTSQEKPQWWYTRGFACFEDKRSAAESGRSIRSDVFGRRRRSPRMHDPDNTNTSTSRIESWPNCCLVPVVPVSILTHGNKETARRHSGNTACSRCSRRSGRGHPRMRVGLLLHTYPIPERREQREQEGGNPLPCGEYPVPVSSAAHGNDGNKAADRGWSA